MVGMCDIKVKRYGQRLPFNMIQHTWAVVRRRIDEIIFVFGVINPISFLDIIFHVFLTVYYAKQTTELYICVLSICIF